jgi:hypothetical protein
MIIGRATGERPLGPVVFRRLLAVLAVSLITGDRAAPARGDTAESLAFPMILTQLPADQLRASPSDGTLRADYGARAQLLLVHPDGTTKVLSQGFHSASDPALSFDGRRLLFAGKLQAADNWNIFEMTVEGKEIRQITKDLGDCRSPDYQATLYTIVSPKPWYQMTFVSSGEGTLNEFGSAPATHLYSCKLDGTAIRRLTYNLSSDFDPWTMDDGRLLFSAWLRCSLERGSVGRVSLFGVNIDGTDYAAYMAIDAGKRIKHMACTTPAGLAVFVETDEAPWDGAGQLGRVLIRRPLHTYAPLTDDASVLYHSPSPLPDGNIFVSRRSADGSDTHAVWRFNPTTGEAKSVFDDPDFHDMHACVVAARKEPDGRSSIVTESDPHAELYCLDVYTTDLPQADTLSPGTAKRVRILEGIPRSRGPESRPDLDHEERERSGRIRIPQIALRRILGEADVAQDGSFHLQVPANTPFQLQLVDEDGTALRSCGWIWAKNHEPRGCIGCHEDGELTPENVLREAIASPAVQLCKPAAERRTLDFRRDVVPIVAAKCAPCHQVGQALPDLSPESVDDSKRPDAYAHHVYRALMQPDDSSEEVAWPGRYIHPGRARTSPLVWHVFGRNTARPWDGSAPGTAVKTIPSEPVVEITDLERKTLVEWIDLGARWAGAAEEK